MKTGTKNILITVAIITVVSIIAYLIVTKMSKNKRIEEAAAKRKQLAKDMADETKETVVDVDGVEKSKTEMVVIEDVRKSSEYKSYYDTTSYQIAANIEDAKGFLNDSEDDITKALTGLNNLQLIAVKDRLCNEFQICSLEIYLQGFLSETEYNAAIELINKARKRV